MTKKLPIGPVMIDLAGQALDAYEREKIQHPNTGAIILFSRNYESPRQIQALIQQIREVRQGEILIAVDQEGGRVQRFKDGFTVLPSAMDYAENSELIEPAGWLMAMELLAVGVDFSFAPVLDVDCGVSEIIGDRSFACNADKVSEYAGLFRKGMRTAGMAATGKHFPGHGAVALDSHLTLPVDERKFDEILKQDLIPFQRLIEQGLEAIMPAHVVYSQVDEMAAGFSPFWIQTILREQLQFNGVVFSDDLSMAGAASVGGFEERARLAQQAGCDMLLVCNDPKAAEQVLETLPIKADSTREQRLATMRGQPLMNRETLLANEQWNKIAMQLQQLGKQYA